MRKKLEVLSAAVIAAGTIILFGTAGASDCQTIDLSTAVLNCSIGVLIASGGALLLRIGRRVC